MVNEILIYENSQIRLMLNASAWRNKIAQRDAYFLSLGASFTSDIDINVMT